MHVSEALIRIEYWANALGPTCRYVSERKLAPDGDFTVLVIIAAAGPMSF